MVNSVRECLMQTLHEEMVQWIEQRSHAFEWFKDRPFNPYQWFINNMREGCAETGSPRLTPKQCVNNSIAMLGSGHGYVEGYFIRSIPIVHAWNCYHGTDEWVDYTITDGADCPYFGVEIPLEVLLMAAEHDWWTRSTGVIETMIGFSDAELVKVKEMLETYGRM